MWFNFHTSDILQCAQRNGFGPVLTDGQRFNYLRVTKKNVVSFLLRAEKSINKAERT